MEPLRAERLSSPLDGPLGLFAWKGVTSAQALEPHLGVGLKTMQVDGEFAGASLRLLGCLSPALDVWHLVKDADGADMILTQPGLVTIRTQCYAYLPVVVGGTDTHLDIYLLG